MIILVVASALKPLKGGFGLIGDNTKGRRPSKSLLFPFFQAFGIIVVVTAGRLAQMVRVLA